MRRTFFCYAFAKDGMWEALCLDLDIAVQGRTFAQVDEYLKTAIYEYIESVKDLPLADQKRLLNRKAPLSARMRFLYRFIMSLFWHDDDGCHHQFTLPGAAPAI